jgi:adenylate cyclase
MIPQETFDFVNAYLRYVSPQIRGHNGFVVKFMGDGMMAVFPNGADDAVAGGISFFKQVQAFNQERETQGYSPIQVGMGIHVGYMMVGVVGEQDRLQGDILSDTVNLTSRLEGLTKYYGVSMVISGDVLERLSYPEQYQVRFIDRAIVKGRTEPISVYEVLDVETEVIQTLKLQTLPDFEQGFDHYCNGNLQLAQGCFNQVLSANPLDKTAKLYLKRITQLTNQGIPKNWRGIWVFTEK